MLVFVQSRTIPTQCQANISPATDEFALASGLRNIRFPKDSISAFGVYTVFGSPAVLDFNPKWLHFITYSLRF